MSMQHTPVNSSMIQSVGHDPETLVMEVKFKSGKTYPYQNVDVEEFEALRDAPSVGKHFNEFWRER